jgi:hypothetical protein
VSEEYNAGKKPQQKVHIAEAYISLREVMVASVDAP